MAQQARVPSAIPLLNPPVTKVIQFSFVLVSLHWALIIAKTAALLANLSTVVNAIVLGAHLLGYPDAFNMTTGPLHWELLRTESKLYVATCSTARNTGSKYVAWGHSTLVGPFEEVLASADHGDAIFIAEIDYSLIEQRRVHLPFINQRRVDLYELVDVERLNAEATS
ncbi:unnamed protein product [Amaranthus hypochondriacus]